MIRKSLILAIFALILPAWLLWAPQTARAAEKTVQLTIPGCNT